MARNKIQFQPGLSLTEFLNRYGTEEQCRPPTESLPIRCTTAHKVDNYNLLHNNTLRFCTSSKDPRINFLHFGRNSRP